DEVRSRCLQEVESVTAVGRQQDPVSQRREDLPEGVPAVLMVLDQKDRRRSGTGRPGWYGPEHRKWLWCRQAHSARGSARRARRGRGLRRRSALGSSEPSGALSTRRWVRFAVLLALARFFWVRSPSSVARNCTRRLQQRGWSALPSWKKTEAPGAMG